VALGGRAGADGCLCLDPADFALLLGWGPPEVRRTLETLAARNALQVEAQAPTCVCVALLWGWSRSTPPADHADHLAAQRMQLANLNAVLRARTEALAMRRIASPRSSATSTAPATSCAAAPFGAACRPGRAQPAPADGGRSNGRPRWSWPRRWSPSSTTSRRISRIGMTR